jgi:ubiquinone/menaquinone biosynthesis C-methylase UbiE
LHDGIYRRALRRAEMSITAIRDRFDRWAATYEVDGFQAELCRRVHDVALSQLRAHAPAARTVLDVGCGTGHLLRALPSAAPHAGAFGVDPAEGMIRAAAARSPRASFVRACALHLPFDAGGFDVVVATLAYRHWPDQPAAARELARVVTGGGILVIADAFPARRRRMLRRTATHLEVLRLLDVIAAAGLRPVEIAYRDGIPPIAEITAVVARKEACATIAA